MVTAQTAVVGKSVVRVEGREKVTGGIRFAGDLHLPGMLYAKLVLSHHAHALIRGVDASAARAIPGVVDVVTGPDLVRSVPTVRDAMLLAYDRVRFYGQPVAVVLADSPAAAADGAAAVMIDYDDLPAITDPLAAMQRDAPLVREQTGEGDDAAAQMHATVSGGGSVDLSHLSANVVGSVKFEQGDVEAGFAAAAHVVERVYRTHRVHQGYMEPQVTVAAVDPVGQVQVWTSTQAIFYVRSATAKALGRSENDVRLIAMPVGGGFGGKFLFLEPLTAALALHSGRPVSLALDRMDDLLSATPAPESVIELKTGVAADGTLTAIQARVIFDGGAGGGSPMNLACLFIGGYYDCPNQLLEGYEVLTNKPTPGAYRAPGAPQAAFALESNMAQHAQHLGLDPIEFRLKNCAVEGDQLPNGQRWPSIGLKECLERLRDHPAYREWRANRGPNEGVGIAIGGWLMGIEPSSATCRMNSDGTLSVLLGAVDLTGSNTAFTQMAAEVFGLPMDRIRVVTGDSETAPFAGGSGGSKIIYTVGPAVIEAVRDARQQLFEIAADMLEASPADLEIVGDEIRVKGVPASGKKIGEVASAAMRPGGKYRPVIGRGQIAQVERAPGFAVHMVRLRVDPDTGHVTLLGYIAVHDVGFAINPAEVEGQIHGGVAQGIGWALKEGMVYDEHGRLITASLLDYALPRADDLPPIEVVLVEKASALGPFGARGIGEPPVIPGAAAIANAIADATGRRVLDLPITPAALQAG